MQPLRFTLNDRLVEVDGESPTTTLLEYLRGSARLTGTKEGCAEGDCGACTVAVLDPHAWGGPRYRAINACLLLLPMVHGRRVYTVEGLYRAGHHHPVQTAMVEHMGSQCGFCTPGVVMSLFEATYRDDLDAPWKLDDQLAGNLCRCTGYRPIRDAARQVAGSRPEDAFLAKLEAEPEPEQMLVYEASGQRFVAPTTIEGLFAAIADNPEYRLVAGATDLGIEVTKKHATWPCLISLLRIPLLRSIEQTDQGWFIGAATRLTDLEAAMAEDLPVVARMLRFFGARQIKHGATLGGNLCNASPIGDLAPVLLALNADAVLQKGEEQRIVSLDDFFTGYRQTAIEPGEVLVGISVPKPNHGARLAAYKVSKRRELDISVVSAGMNVLVDDEDRVVEARIAYGGMAATPKRAAAVEAALVGEEWTEEAVEMATFAIEQDFTPLDDHRGSAWYRTTVAKNLLIGFFAETETDLVPELDDRPSGTVRPEFAP